VPLNRYGCELWDLDNRSLCDLCVAWRKGLRRVWRLPRDAQCDLLCMIPDSIPLEDEIARRYMNFICGCMHCNSTFISSVVRSAFTNMNSPIGKNVRLCSLKYSIGEGDVRCWRFNKEFFVQRFIYGLPREVFAWSKFACQAIALRERLLWLGSYDSALSKEQFSSIIDYIANY